MRTFLAALAMLLFIAASPALAFIRNGENATDELGQFASTTGDTTLNWTQGSINNNAAGTKRPRLV
jgi:hypothetical protein